MGSRDFTPGNGYVPMDQIKRPTIKVPPKHDLDSQAVSKKVVEFKTQLIQLNPTLDPQDWAVGQLANDFHRDLVQASRGVTEVRERGQQREKEQQEAAEAKAAKVAAERQAIADKEIEAEKNRRLRLWQTAGGTEDEFNKTWPEQRLEIIKERANALASQGNAVASRHYRSTF